MAKYTYKAMQRENAVSLNWVIRIRKYRKNLAWTGEIWLDRTKAMKQFLKYFTTLKKKYIEHINLSPNF